MCKKLLCKICKKSLSYTIFSTFWLVVAEYWFKRVIQGCVDYVNHSMSIVFALIIWHVSRTNQSLRHTYINWMAVVKVSSQGNFFSWMAKLLATEAIKSQVNSEVQCSYAAKSLNTVNKVPYTFRSLYWLQFSKMTSKHLIKKVKDNLSAWCSFYFTLLNRYTFFTSPIFLTLFVSRCISDVFRFW